MEHEPKADDKDRKITELEIKIKMLEELVILQDQRIEALTKENAVLKQMLQIGRKFPPDNEANGKEH